MDFYFSPLACSLATRIALYEAGASARFFEVDGKTKRTLPDDASFWEVSALGLVPVLRTDSGELITENAAILQYLADQFPLAALAPASGMARTRLQEWLCFIGTELHKGLFVPLLDPSAPAEVKAYTLTKYMGRLDYLEQRLRGREYVLDGFTVADAYLVAVLNWSIATSIKLADWPAIAAYHKRLHERPSVARAFAEELRLYQQEQARHSRAATAAVESQSV
jgi:glutathione S-transferase